MDKLFDILNSKTKLSSKDLNLLFKNIAKKNYLIMMFNIFKNMRVMDSKSVNENITHNYILQGMKVLNG